MTGKLKDVAHRCLPAAGSEWPLSALGRAIALRHAEAVIASALAAQLHEIDQLCCTLMLDAAKDQASAIPVATSLDAVRVLIRDQQANLAAQVST